MLLSSIPPFFSVHFSFSSLFLSLFYSFSSLANSGNGSCVVNKQSSRSKGGESKARKTENGTKRERLISYLEFRKMKWSKKAQYLRAVQRVLYKTNMMWSGIEALSLRAEANDDRCVEESRCTLIFFPHWKCVVCFAFVFLSWPRLPVCCCSWYWLGSERWRSREGFHRWRSPVQFCQRQPLSSWQLEPWAGRETWLLFAHRSHTELNISLSGLQGFENLLHFPVTIRTAITELGIPCWSGGFLQIGALLWLSSTKELGHSVPPNCGENLARTVFYLWSEVCIKITSFKPTK